MLLFQNQQLLVRQWRFIPNRCRFGCSFIGLALERFRICAFDIALKVLRRAVVTNQACSLSGSLYFIQLFKEGCEYVLKDLGSVIFVETSAKWNCVDETLITVVSVSPTQADPRVGSLISTAGHSLPFVSGFRAMPE